MRCLCVLLILSCFSDLIGQDKDDDRIVGSQHGKVLDYGMDLNEVRDRFDVSYEQFGQLMKSDLGEANKSLEICDGIANELGDSLLIAMVLHGRGYVLLERGNGKRAVEYLRQALEISLRNHFEERSIFVLNSLAIAYSANMEYDKALMMHFESLSLRQKSAKFGNDISIVLANIGSVYAELGDYQLALEYYNKSYNIKVERGNISDMPYLMANMAAIQANLHRYSESLGLISRARSICDSTKCDQRILGELGLLEGTCRISIGELSAGITLLMNVSVILRKLDSFGSLSECHFRIATGMADVGNYDLALQYCDSSYTLGVQSSNKKLMAKGLILKGKCMAALGHYDSAFMCVFQGFKLDSALAQSSLATRIAAVEVALQERENIAKIKLQEEKLRYQQNEIIDNRLLIAAFLLIALLCTILLVASIRISKQRRKINSLLSNRIVESTFELSSVQNSLVHSHDTLKLLVAKLESVLLAENATLKGLRMTSKFESTQDQDLYLEKAEQISSRLVRIIGEFKMNHLK